MTFYHSAEKPRIDALSKSVYETLSCIHGLSLKVPCKRCEDECGNSRRVL